MNLECMIELEKAVSPRKKKHRNDASFFLKIRPI